MEGAAPSLSESCWSQQQSGPPCGEESVDGKRVGTDYFPLTQRLLTQSLQSPASSNQMNFAAPQDSWLLLHFASQETMEACSMHNLGYSCIAEGSPRQQRG